MRPSQPTSTATPPCPPHRARPFRAPGPDRASSWPSSAGLVAACVAALLVYGRTTDRPGEPSGATSPDHTSSLPTAPSGGGGGSGSKSGGAKTVAPVVEPPSKSYKAVDLADGYTFSLSELPPKPYHPRSGPHYEGDFGYFTDWVTQSWGFATPEGNTLVLLTSRQKGSLATCRSATRYSQEISRENAVKGSQICVVTASGHIALVTVRGYSPRARTTTTPRSM